MNDSEVLNGCLGNGDLRDPFRGRRKRRKKRERKMAYSISKLRTMGPVPGIDGVERFQLRDAGPFHDSDQIQASVGDSPRAVCEANQRQHRARRPYFGVGRPSRFQSRERKDNVADRTRTDQKTTVNG